MRYEIVEDKAINFIGLKGLRDDGTEVWIPQDEGNSDYQNYLIWKAGQ